MATNWSEVAVRERAVTLFFIIIVAISGLVAFLNIGRAEDPNFTVKTMLVTAAWPGATAEEMTSQVSDKLEKRLQELRWFDKVETYNRPGLTIMEVTLKDSTPKSAVPDQWYQVRKKLGDERQNLPQGVLGPSFNDEFSDTYFALFAVQAPDLPERELIRRVEQLREQYLQVDGTEKVDIIGEQQQRVFVEFSYKRLATLGIPLATVFDALTRANLVTPSGSVETKADKVYVRIPDKAISEQSIAATPIVAGGRALTLGDIATVRRGYEDPPSYVVRYQGRPAVILGLTMRSGFNGTTFGDALKKKTAAIRAGLPLGMSIAQTADQAKNIEHATGEFALKFVVALTTVMIVSFIALGFRTGLVVAAAVPLTLGLTFVLMLLTGKNFDRITLGALILSLGLLVDDAIIAIEMMIVKMEEGMERKEAAAYAWTSTASPMLFGTLVTIAGFLPVGFAASSSGEYAGNIFWITAFALTTSWFVAVLFTPYLGVLMLPEIKPKEGGHDGIYKTPRYERLRSLIKSAVDRRKLVLIITAAAFVISTLGLVFVVRKQFFPSSDRPELLVEVYMPEGTAIGRTTEAAKAAERIVAKAPETLYYATYIGRGAPRFFLSLNPEQPDTAFAKLVIQTKDAGAREALASRVAAAAANGAVPGARVRVTQLLLGPPIPFPVAFRVLGPDPDGVRAIAARVLAIAEREPKAKAMHLEWGDRAATARLVIDDARLSQLGLTRADLKQQLGTILDGQPITQLREGNRTVDVVGRAIDGQRHDLDALQNLTVTNAAGQSVSLAQVAHIETGFEEPLIKRYNRQVALNVRGDVASPRVQPADATTAIDAKLKDLRLHLPPGYKVEVAGTEEENAKANAAIGALAPVMLLVVITLLMLQVRSFAAMFITLLTAPLAVIGATLFLLVFNAPFGFVAILGLLGLGGILMRNTLILIEQIRENHEREGRDMYESVIEATVHRTRPVVLTALAGMFAFAPLTLTAMWGPMAIVLIGGFGVGTVLTLLFVPALYAWWFKIEPPAPDAPDGGVGRDLAVAG